MFNRNRLFAYSLPMLMPENGNTPGGGNTPDTPPAPPAKPEKPEFDDAQQKYLNDLLARERKDTEEKVALRLKADADAKAKADEEQRERDAAAARGDFDKVRSELEGKVSSAEQERDTLLSEKDSLQGFFDRQYASALKDLPDPILAFKPADDASVETKTKWLETAREQASKIAGTQAPGNRPNPNPSDGKFDRQAEIDKARASGRYRA